MKNILLKLSYDGSRYHGWQIQKNARSICAEVTEAILKLTKEENISLIGASRTDAGVHAIEYVCNFKTGSSIPPERFKYALNTQLPYDIVCHDSYEVDETFHSINDTVKKTYRYVISNGEFAIPFERNYAWHYCHGLDETKMQKAAAYFIGKHDFAAFCSSDTTTLTTVRTILDMKVVRKDNHILIDVTGDGFLYNMVRIIAGTLVEVGIGKIAPEKIEAIIKGKDRTAAGMTAPPYGLYLVKVYVKGSE